MIGEVNHNCGLCVAHTIHDAYSFIKSLQHRGREAAGIAAIGDNRIDVIKWKGTVSSFDTVDLHKILDSSLYHTFIMHVRYATRGRKDMILKDAHPQVIGGTTYDYGNHIIIADCDAAIGHNGTVIDDFLMDVDRDALKTGCDSEAFLHLFFYHMTEQGILEKVPGSYTAAIADKRRKDVIVMRDRTGMKPGVLGWKDGKFCMASEDIALRKNGGEFIEDLEPGAIYYFHPDGSYAKKKVVDPLLRHCFFEWNYLADVDSILNGISVRRVREHLGEILAKEFPFDDVNLVTFLPRCPEVAARRYAEVMGLPFMSVLYKMRGERAFQGSTEGDRRTSIDQNLHIIPFYMELLKGKIVACVDDSTIRGNNSRRERHLFYEIAGVKEARHMNYSPPIGIIGGDGLPRGCKSGGVDMPPSDDNFIARGRTREEISRIMEMPVHYISTEGMLRGFEDLGMSRENLCTFCIGGEDPFKDLSVKR